MRGEKPIYGSLLGLVCLGMGVAFGADRPCAKILPDYGGVIDTFRPGALLFGSRPFVVGKNVATNLIGRAFLRQTIEQVGFDVTADGEIFALTPLKEPLKGKEPSQEDAVKKAGFVRDTTIPAFDLWYKGDVQRVGVWRRQVRKGERYEFKYWVLILGFDPAPVAPVVKDVPRETLYNGITIETNPRDLTQMNKYGDYPLPVPYLDHPPAVIPVDLGRQLFVDDFLIAETTMTRTWHKAQKDPRNPILRIETPLERGELGDARTPMAAPFSGGVWFDGTDGLYKCWYHAGWFDGTAYAYSKDGFDWIRPDLKAVPGTNRIVPPTTREGKKCMRDSAAVILDPDAKDGKRFKAFIWSRPQGGELWTSANGTDWGDRTQCGGSGDRSTIFYNPFRKVWCYSLRAYWYARSRSYAESPDFLAGASYPNEVAWLRADCRDQPEKSWIYCEPDRHFDRKPVPPSLYNFDAVAYESLMLGAYAMMCGADNGECQARMSPKITDLHLGFSRDGFHFSRAEDRSPFLAATRRPDTWDRGYLHSNAAICLVKDDELLFYYTGFAGISLTNNTGRGSPLYDSAQMGLAHLRRDGFASMDAGACGGTLTTRPIVFTKGDRLFVNANAAGGELKVEVLDGERTLLSVQDQDRGTDKSVRSPEKVLATSKPFSANATKAEILGDLGAYAGRPLRLRFTARDAQLYAFWFSDASGRSRGYLAGGSPASKTLRDE